MDDHAKTTPGVFQVMIGEDRGHAGFWPVVNLKDVPRRGFMKPGPMTFVGQSEKRAGIGIGPLRRALEALLASAYGGPVREMLEGLVNGEPRSAAEDHALAGAATGQTKEDRQ